MGGNHHPQMVGLFLGLLHYYTFLMATWGHRGEPQWDTAVTSLWENAIALLLEWPSWLPAILAGMSYFHMFSYLMPYLSIYIYIYIIDGFLSQAILDYVHGGSWTEFLAIETRKKLQVYLQNPVFHQKLRLWWGEQWWTNGFNHRI